MPIRPGKNETEQEWMGRCVPEMIGTGPDKRPQAQAVAICMDIWANRNKESDMAGIEGKVVNVVGRKLYSVLEVKQVDEELRFLRGIATTPAPDRAGDIVEPLGVKFKNPLPLLWQHDSKQPVGQAKLGKATDAGISFEARIPKVSEPGKLKDRLDEVWQSLKAGLVRGVSIGFKAIELSFLKDGGVHFLETEVLELSLVTIPANAQATIDEIKAYDVIQRKDMGEMMPGPAMDEAKPDFISRCVDHMLTCYDGEMTAKEAKAHCSIVWDNRVTTGQKTLSVFGVDPKSAKLVDGGAKANGGANHHQSTKPTRVKTMSKNMTVTEQISAFEAKRAASVASMEAIMAKAADAAQTLDAEESKEYDDLSTEVQQVDNHLKRLREMEQVTKAAAKPVNGHADDGAVISHRSNPVISVKANVPKGTCFTRYAMALAASRGNRWEALNIAKQWHDQTPEVELVLGHDMPTIMKAAIGTGTTTDATWASPLIAYQVMASEFIELLRPQTIIGRIPGLRRVPFNIQMPRTTTGSTVGWVGENAPKPVTSMAFDTVQLRWAKAAGIIVLTDELVRFSNPAAEAVVRSDLIDAMAQFLDKQFVDPTVAAVTNVSPASITNGVSATVRTGTNQAAFVTDVNTMLGTFLTNNLSTAGGVWIMSQRQALAFSLMLTTLGQPYYPGITAEGGTLLGYPVVASEGVPSVGSSPADGTPIIFLLPREIMLADDGQVVIDASNQASIQLDTAPDSPPTASTNMVSLWQMNMTGLRAERWINWLKRRSTAVAYISNANYA